jgi:hypothetical protein
MDFFQSHQTVPKPLLSYLLPYSRTFNCTSKTTGWFTKRLKWSQPAHANKVLLKVAHVLYTWWTSSVAPNCARCYLTFFHIPERSIALVKRLAGSPKGWNWSQPAYANSVTQAFLYTLMDFLVAPNCAQTVAILPSSIFPTFNCTRKLAGSKGWNWSQPAPLTKCYSR